MFHWTEIVEVPSLCRGWGPLVSRFRALFFGLPTASSGVHASPSTYSGLAPWVSVAFAMLPQRLVDACGVVEEGLHARDLALGFCLQLGVDGQPLEVSSSSFPALYLPGKVSRHIAVQVLHFR